MSDSLDPVAVYAAVVSTVALALTAWGRRRAVTVRLWPAMREDGSFGAYAVLINDSAATVFVHHVGLWRRMRRAHPWTVLKSLIRWRRWTRVGWISCQLPPEHSPGPPFNVEPGQSVRIWIPEHQLRESDTYPGQPIRVEVQDGRMRSFFSPGRTTEDLIGPHIPPAASRADIGPKQRAG